MKNYFFSKTIPKCTILNKFQIVKELRTNWKNFPLFEFLSLKNDFNSKSSEIVHHANGIKIYFKLVNKLAL